MGRNDPPARGSLRPRAGRCRPTRRRRRCAAAAAAPEGRRGAAAAACPRAALPTCRRACRAARTCLRSAECGGRVVRFVSCGMRGGRGGNGTSHGRGKGTRVQESGERARVRAFWGCFAHWARRSAGGGARRRRRPGHGRSRRAGCTRRSRRVGHRGGRGGRGCRRCVAGVVGRCGMGRGGERRGDAGDLVTWLHAAIERLRIFGA